MLVAICRLSVVAMMMRHRITRMGRTRDDVVVLVVLLVWLQEECERRRVVSAGRMDDQGITARRAAHRCCVGALAAAALSRRWRRTSDWKRRVTQPRLGRSREGCC